MSAPAVNERTAKCETAIARLEQTVYGNGQPGLEAKFSLQIGQVKGELKNHIESVERHGSNNMREGDQLVLNELKEERDAREKQHEENTKHSERTDKKVDRLMMMNATLSGALIMFKLLEDFGVIHIGGK